MSIKNYILIVFLACSVLPIFGETLTSQELHKNWIDAQIRSKQLFNISLFLQSKVQYYKSLYSISDSIVINLQNINMQQKQIILLKTQQINNEQNINKNLQIQLDKKTVRKQVYFGAGLIIGLIPPCLAIILLGGN